MGLTSAFKEMFEIKADSADFVIALAGNPNTGKSTVFNNLTGLRQHTGNWPGKTVTNAQGTFTYQDKKFLLVDLPGTYSLMANSVDEEVARDFICFAKPDVTVVVMDATCLERNLNLSLQIMEITNNVVVCVNLIDEAQRKKIQVDLEKLQNILGVPVVGTNARDGKGLLELIKAIHNLAVRKNQLRPIQVTYDDVIEEAIAMLSHFTEKIPGQIDSRWLALRLIDSNESILESIKEHFDYDCANDSLLTEKREEVLALFANHAAHIEEIQDRIVSQIIHKAEGIVKEAVNYENKQHSAWDRKVDKILTSKVFGIPIMLTLLGVVFWLTLAGANIPSNLLAQGFGYLEGQITLIFDFFHAPDWLHGLIVLGVFRTLSWVVSVMLPPMAIFFPLFTLLEDLGYLPRVAFNMDNFFKKACAHGKQALTMCMGFGCNAAGVIACRIIDSPRERLIAILTNNFVPCNGRFPTLIALASIFIAYHLGPFQSVGAALSVLGVVVFGVLLTLLLSSILSRTILKGLPSSFTLELPPYRKPQIGRVIVRSVLDRTLFVLARAVIVAAPAGAIIWLMANFSVGEISLLQYCANFLDPLGNLLGMDGNILMAFILGLPANEIVIPILIMSYTSAGALLEVDSMNALRELFVANGWTWLTAVCTMLFVLNHFPCGTTLLTIRKETRSFKWTLLSFIIPTLTGMIICFVVAQSVRLLGLV